MLFWVLIAILILLAAGVGCTLLVLPREEYLVAEVAGFSVVLGALVTSGAWMLFSMGLSGAALRWGVTAVCLGLLAAGLARRGFRIRVRWGAGWAVSLLGALQTAVVYWLSLTIPVGGDGIFIWDLKGRLAFEHGGRIPAVL